MAWANEIAKAIIAKLTEVSSGPEYDEAVQAGTAYWELVLSGKDATAAKQTNDAALSRLLGCSARVHGRKLTARELIWKTIHDSITARHKG